VVYALTVSIGAIINMTVQIRVLRLEGGNS
jgi:hypothetical protein